MLEFSPPQRKAIGRSTHLKHERKKTSHDQREVRLEIARVRDARFRRTVHVDLNISTFHYDAYYLRLQPSGVQEVS